VEIANYPEESLALKKTYRTVKRSRRYLEKWPRYWSSKKFLLRPLAVNDERTAIHFPEILYRTTGATRHHSMVTFGLQMAENI